jgi:predicted MFS family arabinose efflux permease
MLFLLTVHLQTQVGLSPFATGAALGIPGLVSVLSGVLAGRLIGRVGNIRLLVAGMAIQSLVTLPVAFAGTSRAALRVVVPCLFVGFFGHVAAIVSFVVTVVSGARRRGAGPRDRVDVDDSGR